MEFLLIGNSKLKIVLDDEEIKKYKLNSVYAESCDSGFRRNFWKILEKAKETVGFDPGDDKILIQFYPVQSEGCEIFVTKLGLLSDASARMVSRSDKVTLLSRKVGLYSFDSLEDVIMVARLISEKANDVLPICDLYHENGRFYMAIDEYGRSGETMEFPFITEYGCTVPSELVPYIYEHAELYVKTDAVKRLSEL